MARQLTCPCGENLFGRGDDELVERTERHLTEKHSRAYPREAILQMSSFLPDAFLPPDGRA